MIADDADGDGQSLLFRYPKGVMLDSSTKYVAPSVKLEFGTRGDPWPTAKNTVTPYAAEIFPSLFSEPFTEVTALTAERTFWEKATILHQEANRPREKVILPRSSRHYYDLGMLARSRFRQSALSDLNLLERVVQHKRDFFHCGWAKYEEATPGSFRLVPDKYRLKELAADYHAMSIMFFGKAPQFEEILVELEQLETEVNGREL